jgi:hypothetical protein
MAISELFSISMDELMSTEKPTLANEKFAHESVTQYDVRHLTHFDIHAPAASQITITSAADETFRI